MSNDTTQEVYLFGISYSDDAGYIMDALRHHSVNVHELSGEGSRVAGYPVYLEKSEFKKAIEVVTSTHRYRTGDLDFYLMKHPPKLGEAICSEDEAGILAMQEAAREVGGKT